jgi:hypothetical protein
VNLSAEEAGYVEAARSENTKRGYASAWAEFTGWCADQGLEVLPAAPVTISTYLTELARALGEGRHDEPQAVLDQVRAPAA